MKKTSCLLIGLALLFGTGNAQAQESEPPPQAISGISVFASHFIMASPITISYDRLNEKGHRYSGFTTGITFLFLTESWYGVRSVAGGHLAYTLLSGRGKTHFETKLGFSVTPFVLSTPVKGRKSPVNIWPVVSFGLRTKAAKGDPFLRFAIGTGGIGIGFGVML